MALTSIGTSFYQPMGTTAGVEAFRYCSKCNRAVTSKTWVRVKETLHHDLKCEIEKTTYYCRGHEPIPSSVRPEDV
jgi:hypothetical protein